MAYFEFRRFNFFDLIPNIDSGKIAETLQDVRVTVTTSGYGYIVLGDSDGNVHLVNKIFEIRSFRAYERNISLAAQAKHSPYLITIGEDEMGINPVVKVWSIESTEKTRQGRPVCLRVSRCSIPNEAVIPSCLAINDDLTFMAVGFADGSIIVYRGDIKRERTSKQKILYDRTDVLRSSITGLAFQTLGKNTYLYVATLSSVEMYDITHKEYENKMILDNVGCSLGCSVLAEAVDDGESHFIVATDEVIYFYTNGVKGSCQVISGEKIQLAWYRNYLVIVARESQSTYGIAKASSRLSADKDSPVLSVLDLRNKIMAFTGCLKDISVLVEWGSIYAISSDNSVSTIAEIDLQSKLTLLFKKNLYDIGIRMTKDQQYDAEGLMEIFKQYGDYLYNKGDYKTAIDQYIKTIGYLEPSYIIRKYRDSQKVDILPVYLEALHKEGKANRDHTTLLLNCYTKLNKPQLLKEFIRSEEKVVNFDVKAAIEVCRHVALEDALFLAEKYGHHEWFLAIQIEDRKNYDIALDYIAKLNFDQAESMIKKYCSILLENIPDKTTEFLKMLCTNYKSTNSTPVKEDLFGNSTEVEKANPSDYVHYFFNNCKKLVEFLSHIIQTSGTSKCDTHVFTQLLEHYLAMWEESVQGIERTQYQQKIMPLLESRDGQVDRLQAMVLCKAANFTEGLLYLYEQNKMYQAILNHHLNNRDYDSAIQVCRRLGSQEPRLWLQALWALVRLPNKHEYPNSILEEILSVIEEKRLLSPLLVVDALCMSTKVGDVRKYLNSVFQNEVEAKNKEGILIERYKVQMDKIKTTIEDIQFRPMVFPISKCATCDKQLCLPSIHFLCQHSYHQDCYQSFSENENENECLKCSQKNKQILEAISAQDQTRGLAEDFHSQLELADDGFSLVTNFLARGVFNKPTNIPEYAIRAAGITSPQVKSENLPSIHSTNTRESKTNYSNMGQKYGKIFCPPDEALKVKDVPDLSSHFSEPVATRPAQSIPPGKSDMISSSLTTPGNPFEESSGGNPFEDSSGNPFEESGSGNPFNESGSGNPFSDEEDSSYDKNLNPFAS